MMLHCTPPNEQYIPNPALGYLKGFLEAKGIHVKTVYWNLILEEKIQQFQKGFEHYAEDTRFFPVLSALYMVKHLLKDSCDAVTPMDFLYSSAFSKEELSEMVESIKEYINHHIKKNDLHKTDIAGFTLKTLQWPMSVYLIGILRELNPDITIVIGGIINKFQGAAFMKMVDADYALWGEGEYPLWHLVTALREGASLKKVPNLIYRDNSALTATALQDEYPPLDQYPFADHSDYFEAFQKFMVDPQYPVSIPIWGSRSCPWNKCRFCTLNEEYTYRTRSPENIVEEIVYQSERYNSDEFIFVDTEFAGTKKRFKALLKLLIQMSAARMRTYHFCAEISPLLIDQETAKYMQLASFEKTQIGFEAVTDSLLEKMCKRQKFAHNIQALKLSSQYDLELHGLNIIREIPTETVEDILESCTNLRFLRFYLKRHPLTPSFLRLYKGAPFYEDVKEDERKIWNKNSFWEEVALTELVSDENKFDFFGFSKMHHNPQWDTFETLLKFYIKHGCTYEWIEFLDGSSVEEKEPVKGIYMFDRDETDLLIFCDEIRNFFEIKDRFPHLSENRLREMLHELKEAGMLYYGEDLYISVLEADRRKILSL